MLLLQDHFSEGTPEYSTLYIQSGHKLDNEKSLKEIDQLVKKIQADPDVKFASSVTEPNGKSIKRLYVDNQLVLFNYRMVQINFLMVLAVFKVVQISCKLVLDVYKLVQIN